MDSLSIISITPTSELSCRSWEIFLHSDRKIISPIEILVSFLKAFEALKYLLPHELVTEIQDTSDAKHTHALYMRHTKNEPIH